MDETLQLSVGLKIEHGCSSFYPDATSSKLWSQQLKSVFATQMLKKVSVQLIIPLYVHNPFFYSLYMCA